MSFITNSVGLGGKNSSPDVTIIQWMLIRAQNNYGTNLFDRTYNLRETGVADIETNAAIRSLIAYRKKSSGIIYVPPPPPLILNTGSMLFPTVVITPYGEDYEYLLKCSIKPICLTPNGEAKIDFNSDLLATQALIGLLTFQGFKSAVTAKDSAVCETNESKDPNQPTIPFAAYKDSSVRITSSDVVEKLTKIAADYHKATGKTLVFTDGDRTALEQAYLMIPQIEKGKIGIYSLKQAAKDVKNVLDAGKVARKSKDQIVKEIGELIQSQINNNIFISRHLRNRGADVRFWGMDRELFKKIVIKHSGEIVVEDDHFHLQF